MRRAPYESSRPEPAGDAGQDAPSRPLTERAAARRLAEHRRRLRAGGRSAVGGLLRLARTLEPRARRAKRKIASAARRAALGLHRGSMRLGTSVAGRAAGRELARGWAFALLLALGLAGVLFVGANLANATPYPGQPWGWPGPSNLAGGVATVRAELVLVGTVPALLLGLGTTRRLDARRDGAVALSATLSADLALLVSACALGVGLGALSASEADPGGIRVLVSAHLLLAFAFWSIAVAAGALLPIRGAALAGALWVAAAALHEKWLRWRLFRAVGWEGVTSGSFPDWFIGAMAASPLSCYRLYLILGWPPFRDWEERAALGGATLPAWLEPGALALLLLAWTLVPLAAVALIWTLRRRRALRETRPEAQASPA